MNANRKLLFSLESYILFFVHFTGNVISDAEVCPNFLPCGPSPKCVTIAVADADRHVRQKCSRLERKIYSGISLMST